MKKARVCLRKCFGFLVELHIGNRRRALGWPLLISQKGHLSYGVGLPLVLGGLEISLRGDCLISSASVDFAG